MHRLLARVVVGVVLLQFLQVEIAHAMRHAHPSAQGYGLLLVSGRVHATSARILYEVEPALQEECGSLVVRVRTGSPLLGIGPEVVQEFRMTATAAPQVLYLKNLEPDAPYHVSFEPESGHECHASRFGAGHHSVDFHTLSPDGDLPLRVVPVSCVRYYEDQDSEFIEALERDVMGAGGYDLMIHMGDQVYGDWLLHDFGAATYDDVLESFRNLYRFTWTMPALGRLLRHGAHLMIPDDHEVADGLSEEFWEQYPEFAEAAKRAFMEYQTQLMHDIPEPRDLPGGFAEAAAQLLPADFNVQYRGTAIALVDLRWEQAFKPDPIALLTGQRQLHSLQEHLQRWAADSSVKQTMVVSAYPMLYQDEFMAHVAAQIGGEKYATLPEFQNNTLTLLNMVGDYAAENSVLLMSGDLHGFMDYQVCRKQGEGEQCMRQLVTSGLTRTSTTIDRTSLTLYQTVVQKIWPGFLKPWFVRFSNTFLFNNYVVMVVEPDARNNRLLGSNVVTEDNFSWRVTLRSLDPQQRMWHSVADKGAAIVAVLAPTLTLALAACMWSVIKCVRN